MEKNCMNTLLHYTRGYSQNIQIQSHPWLVYFCLLQNKNNAWVSVIASTVRSVHSCILYCSLYPIYLISHMHIMLFPALTLTVTFSFFFAITFFVFGSILICSTVSKNTYELNYSNSLYTCAWL